MAAMACQPHLASQSHCQAGRASFLLFHCLGCTLPSSFTGYVAIGFSDRAGRMGPADAYAGWVDASGVAHVVDFATTGHSITAPDLQQDASEVSGTKANGVLSITFTRKLDTGVCPCHWLWKSGGAGLLVGRPSGPGPIPSLAEGMKWFTAASCRMLLTGSSRTPP